MKHVALVLLLVMVTVGAMAEEMAWINPYLDDTPSTTLPNSMPGWVSSGIFYDEWDTIFRAPAELSNYKGIDVLSSYGNFYSWTDNTAVAVNSPFTAGVANSVNDKDVLLGVAMPLMDWRMAALAGINFVSAAGNLTGGKEIDEGAASQTFDATPADGTADYATASKYSFTDSTRQTSWLAGGALDMGWLGASLYAKVDAKDRNIGGHSQYARTAGTTALVLNDMISASYDYGTGTGGAAWWYGQGLADNDALIGAIAEFPLTPALPITGELTVGFSSRLFGTGSPFSVNQLPVSFSETYATSATEVATYASTRAAGASTGWVTTPSARIDPLTDAAAVGTQATAALDMTKAGYGNFKIGAKAGIDPMFLLLPNLKLVARAKVKYDANIVNAADARLEKGNITGAGTGTAYTGAANLTYTMNSTTTTHDIGLETGGVFELTDDAKFITLGTGLFLIPDWKLASTVKGAATKTLSKSLTGTDAVTAAAGGDMPAAATEAALVALVDSTTVYAGTRAYTATTTYTGSTGTNVTKFTIVVPLSVQFHFAEQKLRLIGGYDVNTGLEVTETYSTEQAAATAYSALTLTNAAGTSTYTAPTAAASAAASTSVPTRNVTSTVMPVSGQFNWMLRWAPVETITVDVSGSSIMTALNFGIFGGGAGFNPSAFLNTLGLSVTFHL